MMKRVLIKTTIGLNQKLIFCFFILFTFQLSYAQENPKKEDSTKMYRDIEKYSNKRKFTKFLHKLIFEPIAKQKKKGRKKVVKKIIERNYTQYECKIIRKINILTLDPFGYSETDTAMHPSRYTYKIGNSLHYKTRKLAIGNLLLIKKNTPLDSLLVKESERLIRSQRYVRSVIINTELVSKYSDSVDVSIRVLDSWSLIPDFSSSGTRSTFKLTDRNFLGTGHEFANTFQKNLTNNESAFSTRYSVPNILQTYIKTTINYQIDLEGQYNKFINIERPFFSPYTRWAAGIYLDQQFINGLFLDPTTATLAQNIKFNSRDYWLGHSFQIFKGNTEQYRTTNLITSFRYLDKNFIERPSFVYDSLNFFSGEKLYLLSIGISSRKFTQEKNLFNFNIIEDVASGVIYNITGGYQKKNHEGRYYLGARFALGKYYDFGYLSTNLEYGTFFRASKSTQTAFVFNAVYFTRLMEMGTWKFRQFIKPQLTIGNNRLETNADKLTLNGDYGIQGFNGTSLFGSKKLLVTFQTQGYSPWNVIGFRLNPYLSYTMGMLGEKKGFSKSRVYSQFGAGIIISNDYLVFSSFQFSLSFYPTIPGEGDAVLKTNSFRTDDFGLQNFELAKPIIVPYQ